MKKFLDADPPATAVVWNRLFHAWDAREAFVDALPPRSVLAIAKARQGAGITSLAAHAVDAEAAAELMAAVPSGPIFYHLTEEWMLPLLEERASESTARVAWLFVLDPKDFVDLESHEVLPLTEESAPMVAKLWEPDWPSEGYVRNRIRNGPSFAIYEDGKPVAWNLTHFETERVGMMGFLHVVEGYRGKGYGKSVASVLIKDILRRGKIPALHVYADNVPSLELTPQLGFHRVKRQVWGDAVLR